MNTSLGLFDQLHEASANAFAISRYLRDPNVSATNREMYLDALDNHLKTMRRLQGRIQKLQRLAGVG